MKKKILKVFIFVFSITLILYPANTLFLVKAVNGDIAGNLYYSDIVVYLNNAPITSYNIGGKTVIDAEILNWHYGFDVYWYGDIRQLEITDRSGNFCSLQAISGELMDKKHGKVGEVSGVYYETDIITLLNGKEIESYNIGHRTFIVAEYMLDFGYNVEWNESTRELKIAKPLDFFRYESDMGIFVSQSPFIKDTQIEASRENKGIDLDGKEIDVEPKERIFLINSPNYWVRLKPILDVIGADYMLEKELFTYESTDAQGKHTDYQGYVYNLLINYDENNHIPMVDMPYEGVQSHHISEGYDIVIIPEDILRLFANGKQYEFIARRHNKSSYQTNAYIHDGELYVPASTIASFLGYTTDNGWEFYKGE